MHTSCAAEHLLPQPPNHSDLDAQDANVAVVAAWHIQDAFDGLERPHPQAWSTSTLRALHVHLRLRDVTYWVRIWFIALSFFERPWWVTGKEDSFERGAYPLSGLPFVSAATGTILEAVFLALLTLDLCLLLCYQCMSRSSMRTWAYAATIIGTAVEQACTPDAESVCAPFFRIALLVLADSSLALAIRRQLRLLARVLIRSAGLACLSVFTVAFFSWCAVVAFAGTAQAREQQPGSTEDFDWAFSDYSETAWGLLVLFTTSNNPDVGMPAINECRASALFFTVFILVTAFFETNMWLAYVYDEYEREHKRMHQSVVRVRERALSRAFQVLACKPESLGTGLNAVEHLDRGTEAQISRGRIKALFQELNRYSAIKYIDDEKARLLFAMLDASGDGKIQAAEFTHLCDLLHIEFCKAQAQQSGKTRTVPFARCLRWFCAGVTFRARDLPSLESVVLSPRFEFAADIVVALNFSLLLAQTWPLLQDSRAVLDSESMRNAPIFFVVTVLFLFEFALRWAAQPWVLFWRGSVLNRVECVVTLTMLALACIICTPLWGLLTQSRREVFLRTGILLRSARTPRLLRRLPQLRRLGRAFALVIEAATSVSVMLFVSMYVFAALGLALFGGRVRTDSSSWEYQALVASGFGGSGGMTGYWAMNFNDMASGLLTLFQLLVANNWNVFADGFVAVSRPSARWFFVVYYIFSKIMVFNIVVAVVLSVFGEQLGQNSSQPQHEQDRSCMSWFVKHMRLCSAADGSATFGTTSTEANEMLHVTSGRGRSRTDEAIVNRNSAAFDAARITGTSTGLNGQYRAVLPQTFNSNLAHFSDLSSLSLASGSGSARHLMSLVHAFTSIEDRDRALQQQQQQSQKTKLDATLQPSAPPVMPVRVVKR